MLMYQENKQACLTLKNPVDHLDTINLQGFLTSSLNFQCFPKERPAPSARLHILRTKRGPAKTQVSTQTCNYVVLNGLLKIKLW